jgi:D-aminopeptidase
MKNKNQIGTLVRHKGSGVQGIVVPTWECREAMRSVMIFNENNYPSSTFTSFAAAFESDYDIVNRAEKAGTVVIMADMEGVTGVPNDWTAVTPAEETGGKPSTGFSASCRAMTLDVLMAVAGARAAGAARIIVADTHWHDSNLTGEDFDVEVLRGSQAAFKAMIGADAAILIGWHARAGTKSACLPHTYTERIKSLKIDGVEVGETGMLARIAASHGTPVVLVTGDRAACVEVESDLGCRTVTSKFVDEDGVVTHRNRSEVCREIVAEAYAAVSNIKTSKLVTHTPGRFEVAVQAGYEVDGDTEVSFVGNGVYSIEMPSILETYGAFQRFVERLPA